MFNTIDSFNGADKRGILNQAAQRVWDDILSGAALLNPALLNRFFMICFADLKQFQFHYWCEGTASPIQALGLVRLI